MVGVDFHSHPVVRAGLSPDLYLVCLFHCPSKKKRLGSQLLLVSLV